jgi:hypothetical protein
LNRNKQETLNNLTTIVKAFQNPLGNLENVLNQLSSLNKKSDTFQQKQQSVQQTKLTLLTHSQLKEPRDTTNKHRVEKTLLNLGDMFTVCQSCGMSIIKDELISGICFNCHNQNELRDVEKEVQHSKDNEQMIQLLGRIGELETQVNSLKLAQQNLSSRTNNLNSNPSKTPLQSIGFSQTQSKGVPPPPPPPQSIMNDFVDIAQLANTTFSNLTMDELESFTHEILSRLSLQQRNQYTSRLKELQSIEQMTSEEKADYLRKKEQANQFCVDQQNIIASLDDSSSPLFKRMREQADKSSLVGKGTLGVLESKEVFVNCYNCNNSNKVIENEDAVCKFCNSPLNNR